jgi:hypothetical protein
MGSRYTKSIPEFIYFTDCGNGWYSGPFVKNPCKGKNANTDGLIICKVVVVPKLVTEEKSNFSPETQQRITDLEKKVNCS